MIEKSELESIAKLNRITPYQQEKHYIQNIVLWSIASESANELVFKGGTALWLFHGLNRFSEDLDFTALGKADYEKLVKAIESQLNFRNINFGIKNIESKMGFSFRIGAEGPLYKNEIDRCFVRVEISERSDIMLPSLLKTYVPPYNDIPPFSIRIMDPIEVLSEKVRAIMSRDKVRDIYDLWFLLKKKTPVDHGLIARKTNSAYSKKKLLDDILRKEKEWEKELGWMVFGKLPVFRDIFNDIKAGIE